MLNFIFPGNKKKSDHARQQEIERSAEAARTQKILEAEQLAQQKMQAKAAALTTVQQGAQAEDEIWLSQQATQSEFAEVRLMAASKVRAENNLQTIANHARTHDRRVYKLVEERLHAFAQNRQTQAQGVQLVAQLHALADAPVIAVNKLSELETQLAQCDVSVLEPDVQNQLQQTRAHIQTRLDNQARLQKTARAQVLAMEALSAHISHAPSSTLEELAEHSRTLDDIEVAMAEVLADPEAAALPQHLIKNFGVHRASLTNLLDTYHVQAQQHASQQNGLNDWLKKIDSTHLALHLQSPTVKHLQSVENLHRQLKHELQQLQLPISQTQELTHQLAQFIQALTAHVQQQTITHAHTTAVQRDAACVTLNNLETALSDGNVSQAAQLLEQIDAKVLSSGESNRLEQARTEIVRLREWARWGGHVAREGLLTQAQILCTNATIKPIEIAAEVKKLREKWQALDGEAGSKNPAPQALWQQFDAACTQAYQPAAAHFKEQAQQRAAQADKARDLIAQASQFVGGFDFDNPNWKKATQFLQQSATHWKRLGVIDRKEKKIIDEHYTHTIQTLQAGVTATIAHEIALRKSLIEQVQTLHNQARTADLPQKITALQTQWQQHAHNFPLPRAEEHQLWQAFRGAIDRVFEKRKEENQQADAARREHQKQKQTLIHELDEFLKQLQTSSQNQLEQRHLIKPFLHKQDLAWRAIGAAPRETESKLQQRFEAAKQALLTHQLGLQAQEKTAQFNQIMARLDLCWQHEQSLNQASDELGQSSFIAELQTQWSSGAPCLPAFEKILQQRFNVTHLPGEFAANQATLNTLLLQLEIALHLPSPAQYEAERLALKVASLSAHLRTHATGKISPIEWLQKVCALSAPCDEPARARLASVIKALATQ